MKTLITGIVALGALAATAANQTIEQLNNRTILRYTVQTACHPDDVKTYDTAKLRERFVMEKVMEPDRINVTYTMYDRLVYGGAMPVKGELTLDTFTGITPP